MAADVIRTELKASGDSRLRAGLRGAIEHLAGRHGMNAVEQREFANEVDAECCKITSGSNAGTSCNVIIEEQEDRMEVKVRSSSHVGSPEGSKHSSTGKHSHRNGPTGRPSDNGHFAATLVRVYQNNPAHS